MRAGLFYSASQNRRIYKAACRGGFVSYYMSAQSKAIKVAYEWEARSQWRRPLRTEELKVSVRFFFGTKRRADLDNFNQLWQDALRHCLGGR
jgi:Holliday junction resolvase RusA-like endonuclease